MINVMVLSGYIANDGKLISNEGKSFYTNSIAHTEIYNGKERCIFINFKCYDGLADHLGKYLKKGHKVTLHGMISLNIYEKNGVKITEPVMKLQHADIHSKFTDTNEDSKLNASSFDVELGSNADLTPVPNDDAPFNNDNTQQPNAFNPNIQGQQGYNPYNPNPNIQGGQQGYNNQYNPNMQGGQPACNPNMQGGQQGYNPYNPSNVQGEQPYNPNPNMQGGQQGYNPYNPTPNMQGGQQGYNNQYNPNMQGGQLAYNPNIQGEQGYNQQNQDMQKSLNPNEGFDAYLNNYLK